MQRREGSLPMNHELKSDPIPFAQVLSGVKEAEVRLNDRDFRVGDMVTLRETRHAGRDMKRDPASYPLLYTGNILSRQISNVTEGYGLEPGYVMLSFERLGRYASIHSRPATRLETGPEGGPDDLREALKLLSDGHGKLLRALSAIGL